MATPRSLIVDPLVTPWYHCISRCVRRAFLCGGEFAHRKQWIEDRLKELVERFAIDCAGFAVLDNHLHLLLRLDPPRAAEWSDEEVARRWCRLFPIQDVDGRALPVSEARVRQVAGDAAGITTFRQRLADLGWFMKCLKEPIARMANREEQCSGAFWAARFKSVAILDEASLLATAAYIDLNPVAAGIAPVPEASEHVVPRAAGPLPRRRPDRHRARRAFERDGRTGARGVGVASSGQRPPRAGRDARGPGAGPDVLVLLPADRLDQPPRP